MASDSRQDEERPDGSVVQGGIVLALIGVLGVLALLYFAWPLWRAQWPIEIDQNEAWNAWWAAAVRDRQPLYPASNALVANNYPPLSFLLIGGLARLGADPLFTGRILSLLATLAASAGVGACASALGASRIAATLAVLWFLATMARFYDSYVGMNDPHLVGLALMIAALAWLLHAERRGKAIWPAFVLMVVAGFYKHSLLATPVAAFLWLALVDRRAALRGALAGALAAILAVAVALAVFGHAFLEQMTAPRVESLGRMLGSLGRLQWIVPGLVIAGIYAWLDRKSERGQFVALFLVIALAVHAWQQTGGGVADNSQFELMAAIAIGIALAFDRAVSSPLPGVSRAGGQILILSVLILRLLASLRGEPYLLLASEPFRRVVAETSALSESEAKRVSALPGPVECTIAMACWRAGKPSVFDPFNMSQRVATGRVTRAEIDAAVAAAGIQTVEIDAGASTSRLRAAANWLSDGR